MQGALTIRDMLAGSWKKSREILFPFRLGSWIRVLIVVWFAGAGIHGCSLNFNFPQRSSKIESPSEKTVSVQSSTTSSEKIAPSGGASASSVPVFQKEGAKPELPRSYSRSIENLRSGIKRWGVWLAVGLGVLGLVLGCFFAWLSCRFNFVLLDVILTRELTIRGAFRNHKAAGNSYFLWTLAFWGIGLASFLLSGLIMVLSWGIAKWIPLLGIPLIGLGGLAILALIVVMFLVGVVMCDFVLPVMYAEGLPAMSALNKFLDSEYFSFGKVFQYLLVSFGLGVLLAILQTVVGIFVAIGGLIAGGLAAVPGFILFKFSPFLQVPLIVFGGLVVVVLGLMVFAVIGMVMLPGVIFLRAFALVYLTRLYPVCDLLGISKESSGPTSLS